MTAGFAGLTAVPAGASGVAYAGGDVFAGIGNAQVKHFDNTGVLKDTLTDVSSSSETTGMAFDTANNLYSTDFTAQTVSKYDSQGNYLSVFANGFAGHPESIVFNNAGDAFVGQADATTIEEFDASGNHLASFTAQTEDRGTDWIDLAADQCTMLYTSEGTSILSYNVCTNTQNPDFVTGMTGANAYALRIRPNGEVLVADSSQVLRFSSTGTLLQTYTFPGSPNDTTLFALNLDPDGTSFWTGDLRTGDVFRVDIATGNILSSFNAAVNVSLAGLAVFHELIVSVTTTTTTTTTMPTTTSTSTSTSSTSTTSTTVPAQGATELGTSLSSSDQSGQSITVLTNTAVTDTATLTGANAASATGTVTYNVYSDSHCSSLVNAGTAEPIVTPGKLPPSSALSLPTAGTYYWQAVYSGDGHNVVSDEPMRVGNRVCYLSHVNKHDHNQHHDDNRRANDYDHNDDYHNAHHDHDKTRLHVRWRVRAPRPRNRFEQLQQASTTITTTEMQIRLQADTPVGRLSVRQGQAPQYGTHDPRHAHFSHTHRHLRRAILGRRRVLHRSCRAHHYGPPPTAIKSCLEVACSTRFETVARVTLPKVPRKFVPHQLPFDQPWHTHELTGR